jgi:hypothetical protein
MALIAGKLVFIGAFISAIVAYLYLKRWPSMQSGYEYIGRKSLILN